jgi:hypothetical protein
MRLDLTFENWESTLKKKISNSWHRDILISAFNGFLNDALTSGVRHENIMEINETYDIFFEGVKSILTVQSGKLCRVRLTFTPTREQIEEFQKP